MKKYLIVVLMISSLLLMSCGEEGKKEVKNETISVTLPTDKELEEKEKEAEEKKVAEETNVSEEEKELPTKTPEEWLEEYKKYKVNEAGKVIVIMYHNLADKPGDYASTPELFRKELERLYNEGYRTVSMTDLINNNIDIEIGTTPVVLTFDDGHKSNFYYDEDGNIAKDCVVGILDDFYKEHPDFGRNAIFYLNSNAFRNEETVKKKLEYLIANGYEIGNHTYNHADLKNLRKDKLQEVIGKEVEYINSLVDYDIKHFAIPFGKRPKNDIDYMFKGEYNGIKYDMVSALNVGWNPVPSPASKKFDPKSINRITCGSGDCRLDYWLDILKDSKNRYISDGNKDTIVIPERLLENIDEKYMERVKTYKED